MHRGWENRKNRELGGAFGDCSHRPDGKLVSKMTMKLLLAWNTERSRREESFRLNEATAMPSYFLPLCPVKPGASPYRRKSPNSVVPFHVHEVTGASLSSDERPTSWPPPSPPPEVGSASRWVVLVGDKSQCLENPCLAPVNLTQNHRTLTFDP
uniref:Uncharacterized protein n=1 Tax=Vespula pensylvanica TaxID=30213 RepID=A0A834P376_VESPE|nr:hypothetical protein H0235_006535 [Vespula pensylvanica]